MATATWGYPLGRRPTYGYHPIVPAAPGPFAHNLQHIPLVPQFHLGEQMLPDRHRCTGTVVRVATETNFAEFELWVCSGVGQEETGVHVVVAMFGCDTNLVRRRGELLRHCAKVLYSRVHVWIAKLRRFCGWIFFLRSTCGSSSLKHATATLLCRL